MILGIWPMEMLVSTRANVQRCGMGLIFSLPELPRPPEDRTVRLSWPSLPALVWLDARQHTGRRSEGERRQRMTSPTFAPSQSQRNMMSHQLRASGAVHMDTNSEVNSGRGAAPRTFHSQTCSTFHVFERKRWNQTDGNGRVTCRKPSNLAT